MRMLHWNQYCNVAVSAMQVVLYVKLKMMTLCCCCCALAVPFEMMCWLHCCGHYDVTWYERCRTTLRTSRWWGLHF